ncbi:hypothetical protein GBAR_LOCUS19053, partial [Geodia barretti]
MSDTPSQPTELSQEEMRHRRLQRLGGLSLQGSSPPSLTPSPGTSTLPHTKTTSPEGRKATPTSSATRGDVMEVEPLPLHRQKKARSPRTTPTILTDHVIRPKAKRSYTGELARAHSLPSPSTPHSSLISLLSQIFRVSLPVTGSNGAGSKDFVPLPQLSQQLRDLGESAYVDVRDLASQLLMERIPLFHEARLDQGTTVADGPSSLPSYLADHTHSSAPSSSLAPRLTNQIAGEGAMAYLLDCYDRSLHESRSTLKVRSPEVDRAAVLSVVSQIVVSFSSLLLTDWLDPPHLQIPTFVAYFSLSLCLSLSLSSLILRLAMYPHRHPL